MFIEAKNINKVYFDKNNKPITVLDNINLSIPKGQFISILGPSGCGKSTFLSMIAGLTNSTSGEIIVNGKKVVKPGKDRGMVFQQAALFPWMNVTENVIFPLRKEISKSEGLKRAQHFLKMVQLSNYPTHYPHELSGGMQQRVSIARSLAMDPAVLLMDEPFGALDEQTRSRLHRQLEEIWIDTRKTIVFVTHSISESIKLSDRIIVMGTRPGTILTDITVDIPRPREQHRQQIGALEEQIMALLKTEIDKVIEEEQSYEADS
ncbi:ABC transporter ATP-binding protein [Planococcus donghaensis MPA1U2]|uniref:Carnitine transport ATP-binding protein OpuCA n=1 Tax=Planococcus donghaensis MPA1U2 TaxID=933115 RepID=E7REP5_9BACL|nr:ABC transporter ATP-binding protein [Planococcus donghaensis]EGA90626.1 ABC transporter ATP-binding protein [Planococcus donghaensis MPA1U2]